MLRPILLLALVASPLAGCAGSNRLDMFPSLAPRVSAAPQSEAAPVAIPPTGPVTSQPLPPPSYPGGAPATVPTNPGGAPQVAGAPLQTTPLPPTLPGAPSSPPVASLPPPNPAPPSQPVVTSSNAAVGTWTARDATGATCRVVLSSAAALDLNRASASGCANRDLQRVNAWKQQGGEIYLYSAGAVVARLPASGGNMSGVLSRSGAPLTLTR